MKIHIIGGFFYPQLGPRSNRITELTKEFIRLGHTVNVTVITETERFDHEAYAKQLGINKWQNLKLYHKPAMGEKVVEGHSKSLPIIPTLHKWADYLMGGNEFFHARIISKSLKIDNDTDMIIAISFPFQCILGTSYYLKKHAVNNYCVFIAESSDPHNGNHLAPWFKYVDRRAYKPFDYLIVPTEIAIPAYADLLPKEKIKVIPQGFNFDEVNLYKGERTKPVKFAYSGSFFKDIRNPEFLFAFLDKQTINYEFHWFMLYEAPYFTELIKKYPNLDNKTHKYVALERDALLYELSKMDFLINIDNATSTQRPSKIIDYAITGRPILSCNRDNFSERKLLEYMKGNYYESLEIDLSKYDIKNVAQQFLLLFDTNNK